MNYLIKLCYVQYGKVDEILTCMYFGSYIFEWPANVIRLFAF